MSWRHPVYGCGDAAVPWRRENVLRVDLSADRRPRPTLANAGPPGHRCRGVRARCQGGDDVWVRGRAGDAAEPTVEPARTSRLPDVQSRSATVSPVRCTTALMCRLGRRSRRRRNQFWRLQRCAIMSPRRPLFARSVSASRPRPPVAPSPPSFSLTPFQVCPFSPVFSAPPSPVFFTPLLPSPPIPGRPLSSAPNDICNFPRFSCKRAPRCAWRSAAGRALCGAPGAPCALPLPSTVPSHPIT